MTTEEIVEAIRNASNGSFIGDYSMSTCMGWKREYDEKGRPVTCDPNYKDSTFNICGREYRVTRYGWHVVIWKNEGGYCRLLSKVKPVDDILAEIDLTPDYVEEYWSRKLKESLSKCTVLELTVDELRNWSEGNNYSIFGNLDSLISDRKYKYWIEISEEANRVPRKIAQIIKIENEE